MLIFPGVLKGYELLVESDVLNMGAMFRAFVDVFCLFGCKPHCLGFSLLGLMRNLDQCKTV